MGSAEHGDRERPERNGPQGDEAGAGGGKQARRWVMPEHPKAARLPSDVGWLLVMGGLIGIAAPGVLGLDMLALGALILWPGNRRRLSLWLDGPEIPARKRETSGALPRKTGGALSA